jgi:hypothetical protein
MHQHALSEESVRSEAERKETLRALRADLLRSDIHKFTRRYRSLHALEALARPNAGREAPGVAHIVRQTLVANEDRGGSAHKTHEDVQRNSIDARKHRQTLKNLDWDAVINKGMS